LQERYLLSIRLFSFLLLFIIIDFHLIYLIFNESIINLLLRYIVYTASKILYIIRFDFTVNLAMDLYFTLTLKYSQANFYGIISPL
jgi:hypothetical protein